MSVNVLKNITWQNKQKYITWKKNKKKYENCCTSPKIYLNNIKKVDK